MRFRNFTCTKSMSLKNKQVVAEFLALSRSMTEKAEELQEVVQRAGVSATYVQSTSGRLRGNEILLEEEGSYSHVYFNRFNSM